MSNTRTLLAAIAAASIAGILTELSVNKNADQIIVKTEKNICIPQITTIPYELRGFHRQLMEKAHEG